MREWQRRERHWQHLQAQNAAQTCPFEARCTVAHIIHGWPPRPPAVPPRRWCEWMDATHTALFRIQHTPWDPAVRRVAQALCMREWCTGDDGVGDDLAPGHFPRTATAAGAVFLALHTLGQAERWPDVVRFLRMGGGTGAGGACTHPLYPPWRNTAHGRTLWHALFRERVDLFPPSTATIRSHQPVALDFL